MEEDEAAGMEWPVDAATDAAQPAVLSPEPSQQSTVHLENQGGKPDNNNKQTLRRRCSRPAERAWSGARLDGYGMHRR